MTKSQSVAPAIVEIKVDRPRYETPRLQALTEKEILKTFQITQSMAGWWNTGMC
jgi:hypothetical protein